MSWVDRQNEDLVLSYKNHTLRSALVDPVLEKARCRHVVVFVTGSVSGAQVTNEMLVVTCEFREHVARRHY